ncbi:hypothetical protein ACGC1H_005981 [Rhizoctonia solani]
MAPPDSFVDSAECERALPMAPLLPCTTPVGQVFDFHFTGPSGRSPYKGEWAPGVGFSFTKLDNVKHSRTTKSRQELQYDGTNTLYRIVRKSAPTPDDNLQEINIQGFAPVDLTVKIEPDSDDTLCPLLKSLYGSNHLPTTRVPKHEQDTGSTIKMETNHELESAPEPRVFERKDSIPPAIMISSVCDIGKTQDNRVPVQHLKHCPHLPDKRQIITKTADVGRLSSDSSGEEISTHTSTRNAVRSFLIGKGQIPPYSELILLLHHLRYLDFRRPSVNGHSTPVAAQPILNSQPPDDSDHDLPNHQDAPQSSQLLKSLYGLAQCLRSQPEVSESSFNQSDTSNAPIFNQEQFNGTQASNTTGVINDSVNNSGQHANYGADETNDVGLASLDPSSLYQLGTFLCTLALQLDTRATNAGTSQNIPYSVHMPSDAPVPWSTHLDDRGIDSDFPATRLSPTFGTQTPPQSHCAEPSPSGLGSSQTFIPRTNGSQLRTDVNAPAPVDLTHTSSILGRGDSYVHPNDQYGHLPANHIMLNRRIPALNTQNNSVAMSTPTANSGSHQYVHIFRADRLDPEPSTLTGPHRTRGPKSNICEVCGEGFRRPSYLKSHMHKHTGVKLHQCSHCDKHLAYPSGLSKHLRKCKAKAGQSRQ